MACAARAPTLWACALVHLTLVVMQTGPAWAATPTGPAMQQSLVLRLTGPGFVPFTLDVQAVLVQAVTEVLLPVGPVQLLAFREGYPDPTAPSNATERFPYTDLSAVAYAMLGSSSGANWQPDVQSLLTVISRTLQLGNFSRSSHSMRLLAWASQQVDVQQPAPLLQILTIEVVLALDVGDPAVGLLAEQANLIEADVTAATADISTRVGVRSRNSSLIQAKLPADLAAQLSGRQLLVLDVTVGACSAADAVHPDCEVQLVQQRLAALLGSSAKVEAWQAAGMRNVTLALVRQRPTPQPPPPQPGTNSTASSPSSNTSDGGTVTATAGSTPVKWIPWFLDRINRREAYPSNTWERKFTANATGTGVHVYLVSSGVRADHKEFAYPGGRQPGTRVVGGWGFQNLDPLEDCGDSFAWYGFGTFAASIIGGANLGAAKNCTLYSARFRSSCLIDDTGSFSPAGLPAAIQWAVDTHTSRNQSEPGIIVIDAWWSRNKFAAGNDKDAFLLALNDALDNAGAANITVLAGSGPKPCDNAIATHPAVISVGSTDPFDEAFHGTNCTRACVDLWGPAAGLGQGMTGAYPTGPADYRTVLPMLSGGCYVAAGVAAQFLSLIPDASPAQVLAALLEMATPHTVTGVTAAANAPAAEACTTSLLYTDLMSTGPADAGSADSEPVVTPTDSASSGGGSSMPVAAIVIAVVAGVGAVAAVTALLIVRRRRRTGSRLAPSESKLFSERSMMLAAEWQIPADQIEICYRPNGSPWLLGEGSFGQVFKAVKGGVQEVAVKKLHGKYMDGPQREHFIQEIMLMKYVSRDANVTQFYGACVEPTTLMLVVELMEGGDLRGALTADRRGELGWYRRGKSVILDILRGLTFLHDSHVIHRDIKSKNVLLSKELRAKIADVGLAKVLEGEEYHPDGVMGTFAWAAPELLLGDECSEKADIYSFGVVLWEVVTQEVPLRGCLHDVRVPEQCPQEVADAIRDCLKSKPAQRPTARELYTRLRACEPTDVDAALSSSLSSIVASSPANSLFPTPTGSHNHHRTMGSQRMAPSTEGGGPHGSGGQGRTQGGFGSGKWSWGSSQRSWGSSSRGGAAAAAAARGGAALEEGHNGAPSAPQGHPPAGPARQLSPGRRSPLPGSPAGAAPARVNPALAAMISRIMPGHSAQVPQQ